MTALPESTSDAAQWQPIETAPRDGSEFWGNEGADAIKMLWHPGFGAFVSSWRRMTMASGYKIEVDGLMQKTKDHSPVIHQPSHWMPMPAPPVPQQITSDGDLMDQNTTEEEQIAMRKLHR